MAKWLLQIATATLSTICASRRFKLARSLLVNLVFPTEIGTLADQDDITRAWTKIAASAGVGQVRLHDLRHAHATLLLQAGTHPKIVSERLGHATVAITLDIYSHVLPGLQAQAALALDALLEKGRLAIG